MYTAWTKSITDTEEKSKLEDSLRHNRWVLELLSTILTKMEDELNYKEISTKVYDSPNWECRQADMIGYRRCLNTIQKLINLDQRETNE